MLNTQITLDDIDSGNATMLEVVWYFSQCRALLTDDTTRVATTKESKLNGNQRQANREAGIVEILEPVSAVEIANALMTLGCYSAQHNALEQVYKLQDKLAEMDTQLAGENDNAYIKGCQKIHNYMIQTGEKIASDLVVGSGKWLKALSLTKQDVYNF